MGFFGFFKKRRSPIREATDRGILVFENTSEVIQAENLLKKSGRWVRVMGLPRKSAPDVIW
ncbi:MAG: DUF3343 domain-containing protein [Desulfobacterales bacterium]